MVEVQVLESKHCSSFKTHFIVLDSMAMKLDTVYIYDGPTPL